MASKPASSPAADPHRGRAGQGFYRFPAVGLVIVAASMVGWAVWGFSYDDAYITYRYAHNFAAHDGLVFNVGERVLGTTAPGYAVLLGVLNLGTGWSAVTWGSVAGLLGLLAAGMSPWLLRADRRPPGSWITLWGLSLVLVRWHVELLGTETLPVLGAMSLAGVLAFGRQRCLTAGLLAALAMSLRFDAVLGAGVLGLALWLVHRRFPWRYLVGTLPAGLTVLAVTGYFGSPLPQTLAGKQGEFADRAVLSYTAAEWHWLTRDLGATGAWVLVAAALLGCVFLFARGGWRHPLVLSSMGWVLGVEVFYRVMRVPFSPWYHVMTVALLLGLSTWAGIEVAGRVSTRTGPWLRVLVASAVLLPILWTSVQFLASTFREPPDPRWRIYRQVGEYLAQQTEPGTVAMVEIGIAGYFAPEHHVLDLIGLVSPATVELGSEEALRSVAPRYVVDPSLFHGRFPELARLGTAEAPGWEVLRTFEDPAAGRGVVRILERAQVETKE